ncbi:MAG TPA: hypothetical protein VIY09_04845 [Rhizomicrobium sp.]
MPPTLSRPCAATAWLSSTSRGGPSAASEGPAASRAEEAARSPAGGLSAFCSFAISEISDCLIESGVAAAWAFPAHGKSTQQNNNAA